MFFLCSIHKLFLQFNNDSKFNSTECTGPYIVTFACQITLTIYENIDKKYHSGQQPSL